MAYPALSVHTPMRPLGLRLQCANFRNQLPLAIAINPSGGAIHQGQRRWPQAQVSQHLGAALIHGASGRGRRQMQHALAQCRQAAQGVRIIQITQ